MVPGAGLLTYNFVYGEYQTHVVLYKSVVSSGK